VIAVDSGTLRAPCAGCSDATRSGCATIRTSIASSSPAALSTPGALPASERARSNPLTVTGPTRPAAM
jgi:hypothetical protein